MDIPIAKFERKIGAGGSSIARAIERDSRITLDLVNKITAAYPEVNKDWLLTGEGKMLTPKPAIVGNAFPLGPIDDENTEKSRNGNEFIDIGQGRYVMLVPKVHEYAYAGYMVGYRDPEYVENLPKHSIIVSERHKGIYRAFEARGESMSDGTERSISENDTVVGRLIPKHHWTSKLHIHRYKEYVLVTKGGILIKQIIAHDVGQGIVTIHSYNPDKTEYPDQEIHLADVDELFNVVDVTKPRK